MLGAPDICEQCRTEGQACWKHSTLDNAVQEVIDGAVRATNDPKAEDDIVYARLDNALDAVLPILLPLANYVEVSRVTEAFIQHLQTNLSTDLCAIFNGPEDDSYHELSEENQRLSKRFQQAGNAGLEWGKRHE